jgi:hypothetical protein
MRKVVFLLPTAIAVTIMAAVTLGHTLPASASTVANLTNGGDPGTCVDADSNHYPSNGDNIQLWACNTHPEQQWILGSLPLSWPGTSGPAAAYKHAGYPYANPAACTDGGACVVDKWGSTKANARHGLPIDSTS